MYALKGHWALDLSVAALRDGLDREISHAVRFIFVIERYSLKRIHCGFDRPFIFDFATHQ